MKIKIHVTQLLFKQDLSLFPCAGNTVSPCAVLGITAVLAASAAGQNMCRELQAPGSVFCPSTSQKPLYQRSNVLHALQQLHFRALCVSVPALTAGMASLCTSARGFQSLEPAGCTAQQAGKQAGYWQPSHTDCGPEFKAVPCQWHPSGKGAKGRSGSPGVVSMRL